jgi:hypothetical protein
MVDVQYAKGASENDDNRNGADDRKMARAKEREPLLHPSIRTRTSLPQWHSEL